MDVKKAELSGPAELAAEAKATLDRYNFLSWLLPFIRSRSTKTDIYALELAAESETLSLYTGKPDFDSSERSENIPNIEHNSAPENSMVTIGLKRKQYPSSLTDNPHWKKSNNSDFHQKVVPKLQQYQPNAANQMYSETPNKEILWKEDDNDLFGKMIGAELKTLSGKKQFLAKREIRNILFTIEMKSLSDSNDNSQIANTLSTDAVTNGFPKTASSVRSSFVD